MCEVRSFPILFTYQERRPPISTLFPYTTLFRSFDRAHAMLVKRGIFLGAIWQIVIRFLFRHNRTGIEERHLFIQHAGVRGAGNIAAGNVGQPEIVVGKMGAHAATHWRMPPMLDIAFTKLMLGGAEKMFADQGRLGVY